MKSSTRFLFVAAALVACFSAAQAADIASINNLTPQEQSLLNQLGSGGGTIANVRPTNFTDARIKVISVPTGSTQLQGSPTQLRQQLLAARPSGINSGLMVNGGFETGDLTGWTTVGAAGTGSPSVCGSALPATAAVLPIGLQAYANNDPLINQVFTGQYGCRLGNDIAWGQSPSTEPQCSSVYQDVTLPTGSVKFAFAYAVLASNPGHGLGYDPYFDVKVEDLTVPATLYDVIDYTTSYNPANPCNPWCLGGFDSYGGSNVVYRRWEKVVLDLTPVAGHTVRLTLKASDCSPSAHFCEAFLDNVGTPCDDTTPPDDAPIGATCAPDANNAGTFCATATWTAPNDATSTDVNGVCTPGNDAAAAYDLRWSTSPIVTQTDFDAATQVTGEPAPAAPGTPESFMFCGLPAGDVYVALQSLDANFNKSGITTTTVSCVDNQNPDCTNATASETTLWPPDHSYHAISILGVTDPDNDPLTITVTGVTQDEPVNTRGDGNTCPDAQIVNGQVSVRAERTGTPSIPGNGRVYAISFTADDGKGGTCNGTVYACVPHDMGQGSTCIDDGQKYNSLGSCHGNGDLAREITEFSMTVAQAVGSQATVDFSLPTTTHVKVAVFDVAGRQLKTLEDSEMLTGSYTRTWNMAGVPQGLYFVRLNAGSTTLTRTVVKVN